jgi:molecular chaperone GrpE (heat shock protein)
MLRLSGALVVRILDALRGQAKADARSQLLNWIDAFERYLDDHGNDSSDNEAN